MEPEGTVAIHVIIHPSGGGLECESQSIPSAYGSLLDSSTQDCSKDSILASAQTAAILPLQEQNGRGLPGVPEAEALSPSPWKAAAFACSFQSLCDTKSLSFMIPQTEWPQQGQTSELQGVSPTLPTCSLHSHF